MAPNTRGHWAPYEEDTLIKNLLTYKNVQSIKTTNNIIRVLDTTLNNAKYYLRKFKWSENKNKEKDKNNKITIYATIQQSKALSPVHKYPTTKKMSNLTGK